MNLPHLSELPAWAGVRRVSIDTETHDEHLTKLGPGWRRGAEIAGISFALDDGTPNCPAFYLPVGHEGGGNYHDPSRVWEYLRDQAKYFEGEIAGANLSYDLDGLANYGVNFKPKKFRDIMISGPLLDVPNLNGRPNLMGLDPQAQRAGLAGKDEAQLKAWALAHGLDPKADMWRAPASIVAKYAIQDARLPLQILRRHERELRDQELWELYDVECDVLPVLVKMRRKGVRVNLDKLDEIRSWCQAKEEELLHEVRRNTGVGIQVGDTMKNELVAQCLITADGLTAEEGKHNSIPRTERKISEKTGKPTGGNLSMTAKWLETVNTPTSRQILRARQVAKIRNTFCKSMFEHEIDGRIHCTFNQLKAETESGDEKGAGGGRLSSSDPNLQQQPSRDPEIGPRWRSLFLPDEGGQWACLDFSSQEPRWITHYAEMIANSASCKWEDAVKEAARAAAHACRTDPNWDNHSMMASMIHPDEFSVERYLAGSKADKQIRGDCKTIFLGKCIAKGTLVLTNWGPKPIEKLCGYHLIWDGTEWVSHGGVRPSGTKECVKVNGTWMTPTHEVLTREGWLQAQDLLARNLPPEWFTGNSRSNPSIWGREAGSSPSCAAAPVVDRLLRAATIWSPDTLLAVLDVVTERLLRHLRSTATFQSPIVQDFLVEFVQSLADATRAHIQGTGKEELSCISRGELIEESFCDTWSRFQDGMTNLLKSTESTTTETTNPETFDSSRMRRTCEIETYDIVDCGPRRRFALANGMVVSNCYGMGGGKLCISLELPTINVVRDPNVPGWAVYPVESDYGQELIDRHKCKPFIMAGPEGQALISKFNDRVPHIPALAKRVQEVAQARGYIKTAFGRICRFPRKHNGQIDWAHKALNKLIQGSAADQTKLAMVAMDKEGIELQLQVHDEVDLTIYDMATAERASEIMSNILPANVPFPVDIETGPSWGEVK